MTVCEHFSQRSTWPPSAAVRQRSMADITLICSRLTWPALAERHAAPWSRKISATSSFGRDIAAGDYAGGGFGAGRLAISWWGFLLGLFGLLARVRQQVEWARNVGDHTGGNPGVTRG